MSPEVTCNKSRVLLYLYFSNCAYILQCIWRKTAILAKIPSKRHSWASHDQILQRFAYLRGVKNARFGRLKNATNCQKNWGVSHDQNLHICGVKNAHFGNQNGKICKKLFLLQIPLKVIWGSPMTKWVKNTHLGSQKCKNLQNICFPPNTSKCYFGVSHDQNWHIWGVKNAHSTTPTKNRWFCPDILNFDWLRALSCKSK